MQGRRSATSTWRSRSARRPTSRTSASGSRATSPPRRSAASRRWRKELLPALDNLDRALAAAGAEPRTTHAARGRAARARELRRRSRASGSRPSRRGRAVRPERARGDGHSSPSRARRRHGRRGLPARLPAGRERLRPARVVVAAEEPMAARPDYYKALGVDKKRHADEIKKAYRKLARQYHPDRNPGDKEAEERFKEISQAHDVLGDPEKRKQYDQRHAARSRRALARRRLRRLRQLRLRRRLDRRHPLEPVRRAASGRRVRTSRAPSAAATSRREVSITFEQAIEGAQVPLPGPDARALPDLPRHRRQARHQPDGLPALPGPRRRVRRARACSRSRSPARAAAAAARSSRTRARPATAPARSAPSSGCA